MFGGQRVGFISIETEGMGPGKWTQDQLAAIKAIILWVHSQQEFPMRVCPAWNSRGVGYHSMFEEWNPHAHSCPGPNRIVQFLDVIEPWLPIALRGPKDSRGPNVDEAIHDLRKAQRHQPRHKAALQAALDALRSINPFTWRKRS